MSTIGSRLREERLRLRMNQDEFATAGGVQRRAQSGYESGERSPDATYLAGVAALGVDVSYVVTGRHAAGSSPERGRDRPPQSEAPVIDLALMQRVAGFVDALCKSRGAVLERTVETEMIVRVYNYLVEDEGDERGVEDRKIERVVRLVVNG